MVKRGETEIGLSIVVREVEDDEGCVDVLVDKGASSRAVAPKAVVSRDEVRLGSAGARLLGW